MKDLFFIVEPKEAGGFYQLIVRGIYVCVSSSPDLSALERTCKKYVRTYRTRGRLIERLKEMENWKPSPSSQVSHEEYEVSPLGDKYASTISRWVEEAFVEYREELKKNNKFLKTKKIKKKIIPTPESGENESTNTENDITAKHVLTTKRPRIFKRK